MLRSCLEPTQADPEGERRQSRRSRTDVTPEDNFNPVSKGSTTPAPAVPAVILAATIVGQRAGRLARIISFRGRAALKSQSAKHQDDDVLHAAFETAISYGEETTNCFAALSQLAVCLFPSQSRNWSEIASAGSVPVARIRKWSPFQVAIRGELFQPK